MVVMLLDEQSKEYIRAAEESGARGYLAKSKATEELPALLDKLKQSNKGTLH